MFNVPALNRSMAKSSLRGIFLLQHSEFCQIMFYKKKPAQSGLLLRASLPSLRAQFSRMVSIKGAKNEFLISRGWKERMETAWPGPGAGVSALAVQGRVGIAQPEVFWQLLRAGVCRLSEL